MRIVATTICAVALAGCASHLPYSIAIDDPKDEKGQRDYTRPDQRDCVLRLDDIVKKVADDYSSSESDVRSLQAQFETKLHNGTQTLEHCNDGNGNPVQHDSFPPIEEIAKKWLTYYALDTTNPDLGLDRFREYVRSAQVVQYLARQQLLPDVSFRTYPSGRRKARHLPPGRENNDDAIRVMRKRSPPHRTDAGPDRGGGEEIPLFQGTIAVPCAGETHGS